MQATAKDLRFHTKEILEAADRGEEVVITYRGKPYVKIVPIEKAQSTDQTSSLFGIWRERSGLDDVGSYVRSLRKGRFDVD